MEPEVPNAAVVEFATAAARRLRKISLLIAAIGGAITIWLAVDEWRKAPPGDSVVGIFAASVMYFGIFAAFAIERWRKAGVALRAGRLAADPSSRWYLDGHRVMAAGHPGLHFRLSLAMRKQLTAMPRATLVAK